MNKKINFDINALKLLYSRYKGLIIPFFVIFISLLLFIKFIIPQIQGLLAARQEIKAANDKLSVMKNNFNILNSLDDAMLENQFQVVSNALPSTKDFNGILNALSIASAKTGASLGSFSFKVGDLSAIKDSAGKHLFLKLSLNVNGDINTVNNFINTLNNTLPLSEVTSVEMESKNSTLTITFYYKPLPPIIYSDDLPIAVISKNDSVLINKLFSFRKPSLSNSFVPASSRSAISNPF